MSLADQNAYTSAKAAEGVLYQGGDAITSKVGT